MLQHNDRANEVEFAILKHGESVTARHLEAKVVPTFVEESGLLHHHWRNVHRDARVEHFSKRPGQSSDAASHVECHVPPLWQPAPAGERHQTGDLRTPGCEEAFMLPPPPTRARLADDRPQGILAGESVPFFLLTS